MADGNETVAPSQPHQGQSTVKGPHCKACLGPVKDHVGPHGVGKCVVGILNGLQSRIEKLESALVASEAQHEKELEQLNTAHEKKVEALLAVLDCLERKMNVLQSCKEDGEMGSNVSCMKGGPTSQLSKELPVSDREASPVSSDINFVLSKEKNNDASFSVEMVSSQPVKVEQNVCERSVTCFGTEKDPEQVETSTTDMTEEEGSWSSVVRRRHRPRTHRTSELETNTHKTGLRGSKSRAMLSSKGRTQMKSPLGQLRGSEQMLAQPFHLSGISVDCSAEDVVGYCRGKGIAVTGCFFLPAKVWHGTSTAKLFAVSSAKEQLLLRSFWPEYVVCRPWESSPPATKQVLSAKASQKYLVQAADTPDVL